MKADRERRMVRSELLELIAVFMTVVFASVFRFLALFMPVHMRKRWDPLKPAIPARMFYFWWFCENPSGVTIVWCLLRG